MINRQNKSYWISFDVPPDLISLEIYYIAFLSAVDFHCSHLINDCFTPGVVGECS